MESPKLNPSIIQKHFRGYIIRKQILIPSSAFQTKNWRKNRPWYKNGKSNECEKYQIDIIEKIIGVKLPKTNDRINMETNEIISNKNPMSYDNGYEWTENFDGKVYESLQNKTTYFNLKFVCDNGGAQTRSLKEVYSFIKNQIHFLLKFNTNNIYFINILDGDTSFYNMNKFKYLLNNHSQLAKYIFIGDLSQFQKQYNRIGIARIGIARIGIARIGIARIGIARIGIAVAKKVKKEVIEVKKEVIEVKKEVIEVKKSIKKEMGQFYTTNQKYILQNMNIPEYVNIIIEPFAGNGDLINTLDKKYILECYDLDPKNTENIVSDTFKILQRDTINNPPSYHDKFIITNPPYLARNKSSNKVAFDKYDVNDLYKCFIKELLTNKCLGGILIIPLNFWSSIRKSDILLRQYFLQIYNIIFLNIFEETVFNDTTYTICSFQFELKHDNILDQFTIMIHPSKIIINAELNETNNYSIGGDIYNLPLKHEYKITRITSKNKDLANTNITVKCIDDNKMNQIKLLISDKLYIDETTNQSARTYASLIIEPQIDKEKQQLLVEKFNAFLNTYRDKYHSLFLTNYRESKDIARKRISFDLVYSIVGYILENIDNLLENIDNL
jgi:hypothetical protein